MKTVAVALSGGIDSGVAALILKQMGYRVIGYTLLLTGLENVDLVRGIVDILKIEHRFIDARDLFERDVVKRFVEEYSRGRTPNPCVLCNRLKFSCGVRLVEEFGGGLVASGHYACIRDGLLYASESPKDQSYFLAGIPAGLLGRIVLPLCGREKDDVRGMARGAGFPVDVMVESQDVCFVGGDYRDFLRKRGVGCKQGTIVSVDGEQLSIHEGVSNYTVGQRLGLGGMRKRMYVVSINAGNGTVVAGTEEYLYSKEFEIKDFNCLVDGDKFDGELCVKVRYSDVYHRCSVISEGERLKVFVQDGIRAVTPGQFAVIYENLGRGRYLVLGGGWIV